MYMAPEMQGLVHGVSSAALGRVSYSYPVDIWAAGVITHLILTGRTPFHMGGLASYSKGDLAFPVQYMEQSLATVEARNFVQRLLAAQPNKRPTASECLDSSWLCDQTQGIDGPLMHTLHPQSFREQAEDETYGSLGTWSSEGPEARNITHLDQDYADATLMPTSIYSGTIKGNQARDLTTVQEHTTIGTQHDTAPNAAEITEVRDGLPLSHSTKTETEDSPSTGRPHDPAGERCDTAASAPLARAYAVERQAERRDPPQRSDHEGSKMLSQMDANARERHDHTAERVAASTLPSLDFSRVATLKRIVDGKTVQLTTAPSRTSTPDGAHVESDPGFKVSGTRPSEIPESDKLLDPSHGLSEHSVNLDPSASSTLKHKGKTRMPKRLVHADALRDCAYPYEEEERFFIILIALSKEQIDEVLKISHMYRTQGLQYHRPT